MKKYVVLMVFLLKTLYASAHPHLFFSSRFDVVFEENALKGAYCEWTFDRFFSADIIQGFDLNHDGIFNEKETQDVYENAFIYTKNFHYFTFIRQGKKRSTPLHVSQFSARYKKGIVTYRFYIDLSQYPKGDIYLSSYDYTFFCAISYVKKNPVNFICNKCNRTLLKPRFEIKENKNYPVYYDPFDSAGSEAIYDTWKKGLEIFYPLEIRISYE